jgi:hypothetical protein
VRIPAEHPWKLKAHLISTQFNALQPECVSLHYVPYAYNNKGLPFALLTSLIPLRHQARWEITAHELWVDPSFSLRYRILSKLQRLIFLRLCAKLDPEIVHVTNSCYQSQLEQCGIKSSILPLFSSIPLCPLQSPIRAVESQWTFVIFGSINRDWHPTQLLERIEIARDVHGIRTCRFLSIGNIGNYGAKLWDSLNALPYPAFEFSRLGVLPEERVSKQLQLADFGICIVPSGLIGKSSAVAAMLAHGLPIIISRLSSGCDSLHEDLRRSGKFILADSSFVESLGAAQSYPPEDQLSDTTNRFVRALSLDG